MHEQPDARWRPTTLAEIETAINNGLVEENHFLDLKRELTGGNGTNFFMAVAPAISVFAFLDNRFACRFDAAKVLLISRICTFESCRGHQ